MSTKSFLSGSKFKSANVGMLVARAGIALFQKKPKRALMYAGAALVSTKSTVGGLVAQALIKILGRK
ncbi:hypothetical protein [Halopelagius longus]|uniref:Uncharacterized protein n=1 Tax=Halopelagius longus TaxID=1236180 RepID=A0A1H1DWS7_9EURY|nr:hypothetical protein [Halopelagius longus]RDI71500.1 hypothetical protein DWB78_07070 [Halopelagius longus]SDQ80813.1 hypothetical protein SAMN05216278_2618 [Halopelagius longus]